MAGPIQKVEDTVQDIGDTVGNFVHQIGNVAEKAAETIGTVAKNIGDTAKNDPIGTVAKIAAVATGNAWALPLISAADVVAHGGNLQDAAKAGAVSYVGGQIAQGISGALAAGSESTLEGVKTGADGSTVYSYSDGSTMTSAADGTTSFTNPTNITGALNAGISNGAANAATTLAMTGDINKAITSGLTTGAGSYVGSSVTSGLTDNVTTPGAKLAGSVAGGATASVLSGKDPTTNIVNSIIATTLSETGSQIKSMWNNMTATVSQYNEQQKAAQDLLNNTVIPAQKAAQDAQQAAKESYDAYTPVRSKFDDLNSQYNDAVAAGNTTLANDLADKANALIPQVNEVTNKYNADAAVLQAKLDIFNTSNTKLADTGKQLDTFKSDYVNQNNEFEKASTELTSAATKVATMSPEAQKAFTSVYGSGADVATALDTTTKVNSMDPVAQAAFTRNFSAEKDLTKSLDFATQVNSLDTGSKSAYSMAVKNGMNDAQAISLAPQIGGMNATGQTEYFNAINKGLSPQDAAISATLADMFPQSTTQPTTATPTDKTTTPASTSPTSTSSGPNVSGLINALMSGSTPKPSTTSTPPTPTPTPTATPTITPAAAVTPVVPDLTPTTTATMSPTAATPTASNTGGVPTLTAGLTPKNENYTLTGMPNIQESVSQLPQTMNPNQTQLSMIQMPPVPEFAEGGSSTPAAYDYSATPTALTPTLTKRKNLDYILTGLGGANITVRGHADGGEIEQEDHNATFFSPGGLANTYVQGDGDGTSDSVKAMLANGEFVIPADVVSDLGNGSNEAGASVLDQFLKSIREHKQSNGVELPPDSKGPLAYLTDAARKVKA